MITRAVPLRIMLLRALVERGPQTSMQLTLLLDPYPHRPLTHARVGVNSRLTTLGGAGYAEVCGTVPAEYHNTPAFLWRITAAGRKYLKDWKPGPAKAHAQAQARAERAERKEAMVRSLIRQAMDSKWGPGTPTAERREASRKLREQGMPYDWIAAVFEVSHEQIRLDCRGLATRNGSLVRVAPPVVPPEGAPGYVWARTREGVA